MSYIDIDVGPVRELVTNKFESTQTFATELWDLAKTYLQDMQLGASSFSINLGNLDIPPMNTDADDPEAPREPDTSVELPDKPGGIETTSISIPDLDIPSLDAVAPDIIIPDEPSEDYPEDPGDGPTIRYPDIPTKPSYDLPDAPEFEELTFPEVPEVETISFEGEYPTCDLDPPSSVFVYEDPGYTSMLADAVKEKLQDLVENGGTGLAAEIEDAIWERSKDRLALENEKTYSDAENYFASKGFSIPPGALMGRLAEVIKEQERAVQQLNYEISIEQAKLAQTNTHFAITSTIQYEASLMAFFTETQNRALNAAKTVQDAAIAVFNANIALYKARLAGYQTRAAVYESRIRASLAVIERYRAQMEGVRVKAEVQRTQVDLYRSQIAAVSTLIDLYRVEMESASIQANIERTKLDVYRGKIDVYNAKLNAMVSSFNLYQAKIAGQAAKASLYSEQVRAYANEVNAVRAKADIDIAKANVILESNRNKIDILRAKIEEWNAEVKAKMSELETKARIYGYSVEGYRAEIDRSRTQIQANVDKYRAESDHAANYARVALENSKLFLDEVNRQKELEFKIADSSARITAQMAASAISAVAAGVQMSMRGTLSGEVGEYYNHELSA